MLVKMSLFVLTNKVFREIIVWLHEHLHILHTVTAWQATVLTNTCNWKFHFSEQTKFLMTLTTFTYAKLAKSHGIAEFSNKIIEWKATCSKPHLHERGWSSTKKQISQCRNLHQDLHKTATSLIRRMNFQIAPFIPELGEQRLHTDALYTQDKSSIMNISIYTYWKLAEPWQFKQLQNTAPQALINGANI